MRIGNHDLDRRVLIVAEIGNNHEGDVGLAERLIGLAADAGVDAVKFQTFRTDAFVRRTDADRYAQLRRFELPPASLEHLAAVTRRHGLLFISTPLDLDSVNVLDPLVDAYKIASGDNTFLPLLEAVAATDKPVIMSTGLASFEQIARAWHVLADVPAALLHCVSSYPTPDDQVNLAAIRTLRRAFGCTVGYSDHTLGLDAAVLAVAAGARIIEKHFTIDHDHSDFRDHALSADPDELQQLVTRIRAAESMQGDGRRQPQPCERDMIAATRRSAVASRDLPAGRTITADDIRWIRPGDGVAPEQAALLIGGTLATPVAAGATIHLEALALPELAGAS